MYKDNIIRILVKTAIGFAVAFFVMTHLENDWGFSAWCSMAFVFSTVPYGWTTVNKYLGNWFVTGSIVAVVISFFAKFLLSLLVGWIVLPIALIYNIVKMVRENKQMQLESTTNL